MSRVSCANPGCGWAAGSEPLGPTVGSPCPSCGAPLRDDGKVAPPGPRLDLRDVVEGGFVRVAPSAGPVIAFVCTHEGCRARSLARAESAGRSVVCPRCGRPVVVSPLPAGPALATNPSAPGGLRVTCLHCRGRLLVSPNARGREVVCAHCRRRTPVPADPVAGAPGAG